MPEAIEHFETEAHHFYTAEAALELRQALDAFTGGRIVIGIAGMPYKCPPAPLEVAFLIEAELRQRGLRDKSELHFCSPIGRAFTIESVSEMATPILEQKGIELHTFFNVEAIDPQRKVVQSLEGEELPYDLLILVPPHKGQQFLIDSGLAPAPGGWLPTDRPRSRSAGDRTSSPWATRPTCRSRRPARPRTSRRPSSPSGSSPRSRAAQVDPQARRLPRQGHVLLRDRRRQGHAPPVRLRAPAAPAKPNQLWHLGKIVFNKTYWHTVPKGRV